MVGSHKELPLMKPTAAKPATTGPTSASTSLKFELLSYGANQPSQPIRFEFGPSKESFTLDLPVDQNDGSIKQQTWREWKRRAIEHATVKKYFKASAALYIGEFALRVPVGGIGGGDWIGPESQRDDGEADNKELLRIAGVTGSTGSILLLYAPNIHICTFDGIKFSACSFGHWLAASDTKTLERIRSSSSAQSGTFPNDALLTENHQLDLARLLLRVALFMNEELKLESDAYILSIPFGQYVNADGDACYRDEVRAKVQLTDIRAFWTLLLKFEEKLVDDKRLDYFVHQRHAWFDARTTDYKRWAEQEANSVRSALDVKPAAPGVQFKLPKNCSWDEYGRMQLCLKMLSPLTDMVGQMGSISAKLKAVVTAIQMVAYLPGDGTPNSPVSINVSTRADQCLVLLPADRYMRVLTRASADPKTWGAALLDALRDAPDRLYSGLLYETPALYQIPSTSWRDDMFRIDECLRSLAPKMPGFKGIAKLVDTSVLPLNVDVIRSLESKNHTDKRLFLDRAAQEQKAFGGGVVLSVLTPSTAAAPQPSVWDKKRIAALPVPQHQQTMREGAIGLTSSDREDMQLRQHAAGATSLVRTDDFVRFDSDATKAAPREKVFDPSAPTLAQAVAQTRQVPAPQQQVQSRPSVPPQSRFGNASSTERAPPPTVAAFNQEKVNGPPSVLGNRAGPPRVMVSEPGSERSAPPSVMAGPPRVLERLGSAPTKPGPPMIASKPATTMVESIAHPPPRIIERRPQTQQPREEAEWGRGKMAGGVTGPQETEREQQFSTTIRGDMDREDRTFESSNGGGNGRGGRGSGYNRGRMSGGRGRGGFRGRGGDFPGNSPGNFESGDAPH